MSAGGSRINAKRRDLLRSVAQVRRNSHKVAPHAESRGAARRYVMGIRSDPHQGPLSRSAHVDATAIEALMTATAADHRL